MIVKFKNYAKGKEIDATCLKAFTKLAVPSAMVFLET
jgi:hypothetical protein